MAIDVTDLSGSWDGSTPIAHDEMEQLIPTWPATRRDVNALEATSIALASLQLSRVTSADTVLARHWLIALHRSMFEGVWRWAGELRKVDLSIGVEWYRIESTLKLAIDDAKLWFADGDDPSHAAVAFHHRLVEVHAFHNGNGRHARVVADTLVRVTGGEPLTWGASVSKPDERRQAYLAGLREADRTRDVTALVRFARS